MLAFLSDPPPMLWVFLVLLALVSVGLWLRSRNRILAILAVVSVVLMVLLFLCRFLVESPRQEAIRRMKAIVSAVDARNPDGVLPHIADDFEYQGRKKGDIKTTPFWNLLQQNRVRISASAFGQDDEQPNDNTVIIGFTGWASTDGKDYPMYIRATYKKTSTGEWKLKTFKVYLDPIQKANGPETTIPGL